MRAERHAWQGIVAGLLVALLLAGCGSAGSDVPASTAIPVTSPVLPAPTETTPVAIPVGSPAPAGTEVTAPPPVTGTEDHASLALPCAGVSLGESWTHYLGTYQVNEVAFGVDSVAWATDGGVLVWGRQAEVPAHYTAADGLGTDFATDVAIAPDGSVWTATLGGVSHLVDGAWITYTRADGLADDAPQAIEVTAGGVVWVGTTQGVSRYTDGVWTSFLPGTRAWEIDLGPDGSVWFAADAAGLIRYQPAGDTWTTYLPSGDLSPGVKTVGIDPQGNPWVYQGYDRVYRVDVDGDDSASPWEPVYDAGGEWVCGIDFSADGTPWLATCHGFHTYGAGLVTRDAQGGEWRHVTEEHGLSSLNVLAVDAASGAVAAESGWELVAATDRGLDVRRADGRWDLYLGCGPVSNRITAVTESRLGAEDGGSIAWFGFGGETQPLPRGGVSRFDLSAPAAIPDTASAGDWWRLLDEANVQVLATAPDGSVWAGAGCQVYRLDKAVTPQELLADPDWPFVANCDTFQGNVLDFAFEPGGGVWVATGLDLARFDGIDWQVYDRMVNSAAVAPSGDLWAAGWEGTQGSDYVARYDGQTWTEVLDRGLGSLAVTAGGEVWGLAGEQGVARFDGEEWTWYDAVEGRPLGTASALVTSSDGQAVWVAAAGALFRFAGETWTVYELPAPVAELAIEDMATTAEGVIWLATSRGALRFAPDEQ